ncbi:MAG: hypothetical protein N7Q72_03260, partial [Spiroplasma sp. Tabriz.8]|nr:hypothetical protein [Spiroplasma sp. Tabriz.8]
MTVGVEIPVLNHSSYPFSQNMGRDLSGINLFLLKPVKIKCFFFFFFFFFSSCPSCFSFHTCSSSIDLFLQNS